VYRGLVRGGDGYDVFLSYSRADSAVAESLRARLKEAGLSAFLDRYGLPAGQPWQPWLERQLSSCRALVALVGPQGFGEWQHREIELGLDRQALAAKGRCGTRARSWAPSIRRTASASCRGLKTRC
jgi:hypothetical protein